MRWAGAIPWPYPRSMPPLDPKSLLITAANPVAGRPLRYVDIEATGVHGAARIIEIAIVDDDGRVLLSTLVNPQVAIPGLIQRLTGITPAMVWGSPTWAQLAPRVAALFRDCEVIAHNAVYERGRLAAELVDAAAITCTLKMCRQRLGEPLKLGVAAVRAGHVFTGTAHRALADTLAGRAVHQWLLTYPEPAAPLPVAERGGWQYVGGRRVWMTPADLHRRLHADRGQRPG